jgi:hypothetical protein
MPVPSKRSQGNGTGQCMTTAGTRRINSKGRRGFRAAVTRKPVGLQGQDGGWSFFSIVDRAKTVVERECRELGTRWRRGSGGVLQLQAQSLRAPENCWIHQGYSLTLSAGTITLWPALRKSGHNQKEISPLVWFAVISIKTT